MSIGCRWVGHRRWAHLSTAHSPHPPSCQDNATFPEFLTFHGQTTVSDTGGNLLYVGPPAAAALAHVTLNFTGYNPGSTAHGRPAPDMRGLCDNVTET